MHFTWFVMSLFGSQRQVIPKNIVSSSQNWNSSEIFACSDYLQVKDRIKYKQVMADKKSNMFFSHSRAGKSKANRLVWQELELIQDFVSLLVI